MNHNYDASDKDDPTNHDPPTLKKAGIGKIRQIITELAHRSADNPNFEWVDPKGDSQDNTTGGDN